MIFVTVGTHHQGFTRLIKEMDKIAGKISEEVIMQIGHTKYIPKNVEFFDFKSDLKIQYLIKKARVVICHDGAGSIIEAMQYNKPLIVVPRLKKYNEISYDNKADLAIELEKEGKITFVDKIADLENILKNINTNNINIKQDKRLINALKQYINQLDKNVIIELNFNE